MIYKYRLNSQITVTINLPHNINYSMPDLIHYMFIIINTLETTHNIRYILAFRRSITYIPIFCKARYTSTNEHRTNSER